MKREKQNEMQLALDSRSVNEGFARAAVAAFAAQLDPTLEELNDIKTVVSEAVTNCIVHAYPDTCGKIHILCRIYSGGLLEVTVRDRGCGIADIEKAREPLFTTGGSDRAGMGFTIMESFTDGFRISSREGRGTSVTMRKLIAPRLRGGRPA
ncbi:MAG: anti-sigma F factor [Clostridia bacterium]|nr:anti-sigma F factor [Clostridia bacterium]